jgi:hypothetical protein
MPLMPHPPAYFCFLAHQLIFPTSDRVTKYIIKEGNRGNTTTNNVTYFVVFTFKSSEMNEFYHHPSQPTQNKTMDKFPCSL